jgi:hypothetical protein
MNSNTIRHCDFCNTDVCGEKNWAAHIVGRKHINAVNSAPLHESVQLPDAPKGNEESYNILLGYLKEYKEAQLKEVPPAPFNAETAEMIKTLHLGLAKVLSPQDVNEILYQKKRYLDRLDESLEKASDPTLIEYYENTKRTLLTNYTILQSLMYYLITEWLRVRGAARLA